MIALYNRLGADARNVAVSLDVPVLDKLKELADAEERTVASYIRRIIEAHYQAQAIRLPDRRKKLRELAG